MGLFYNYTDGDKINHIALIIMAYENGAVLDIESHPEDVGPYWIEYEYQECGAVKLHLESHASELEQKNSLLVLQNLNYIRITGYGKLLKKDANELLKPLFRKIQKLEDEINIISVAK